MNITTRALFERISKLPIKREDNPVTVLIRPDGNSTIFTIRENNQYPASIEFRLGERGREYLSVRGHDRKKQTFHLSDETAEPIAILLCTFLLRTGQKS